MPSQHRASPPRRLVQGLMFCLLGDLHTDSYHMPFGYTTSYLHGVSRAQAATQSHHHHVKNQTRRLARAPPSFPHVPSRSFERRCWLECLWVRLSVQAVIMASRRCSGIECTKAATKLKCPTCQKLGLPNTYFCSQACFKENWLVHKLIHSRACITAPLLLGLRVWCP